MKAGPYRLARGGSMIERRKLVRFRFNDRELQGFRGDTLASALLANGVRTVARSIKFHRPRGIFSAGSEEPNALVDLGEGARRIPSARAPLIELREGLEANSQGGWPSTRFDMGRTLDFVAPLWAAGFYNKTFIWPSWPAYEAVIRRLTARARLPSGPDPDRYETQNIHCDVLIVGAGVSGLQRALASAKDGLSVMVVDQAAFAGGRGAWDGTHIEGINGWDWVNRSVRSLAATPEVRVMLLTAAVAYYDNDVVALAEDLAGSMAAQEGQIGSPRERFWLVRAKKVVVASGGIEQPLVFSNNDRPGIFLAGAAHQYFAQFGIAPGRRTVVATNNDSAYAVAAAMREADIPIESIIDSRAAVPAVSLARAERLSIRVHAGSMPVDTTGFSALSGVMIGRLSSDGRSVVSRQEIRCDALLVSGGWNPALQLFSQAGGRLRYNSQSTVFEPAASLSSVSVEHAEPISPEVVGIRLCPEGNRQRQWVDLRHDVTVADLELAIAENYSSVEHVKRYTTVGMSVDQGRTSQLAAIEMIALARGIPVEEIGHTTIRPPVVPVSLGALTGSTRGQLYRPWRTTSLHKTLTRQGAQFQDYGDWKRAAAFPRDGEPLRLAIDREAHSVRTGVGLFDASTLGKIEIRGPDSGQFLDRFYINRMESLVPGQIRYGIMLRESGVIFDDGTVTCLAPDRFVITTTSGNAARVLAWLEEWHQCEWAHLRLVISDVTDQWATIAVSGPQSREVVSRAITDINWNTQAFPHMTLRVGHIVGRAARVYRMSFTGELTYEVNVPADAAADAWALLSEVGDGFEAQPFGVEALLRLRLEKGYLHIGSDTDGGTVPRDIGWGHVADKKASHYIGKRSLSLANNVRNDRLQLVGLRGESGYDIPVGAHLSLPSSITTSSGWVTSAAREVMTGAPIAMALLLDGRAKIGTQVSVHDAGVVSTANVVNLPFYDPKGERLHG